MGGFFIAMPQSQAEIKAQREYYQRANGPVAGQRSTYNTQPNKLFKEEQAAGRIPAHFTSWKDAETQFLAAVDSGMKPEEARKALGLTYRNVIGKPYFDVGSDRYTGGRVGFEPRHVNEDLHPTAELELRRTQGDAAVDTWRSQLFDGWGDAKGKKAYDPMAPTSKGEAESVRSRLSSAFGRGDPRDRGGQIHRGHGFSASQSGGSVEPSDLWAEMGWYNVNGHSGLAGNPRYHPDTMLELNASPTEEHGFFNNMLNREGLSINPRETQHSGAMIAVDENNGEIVRKPLTSQDYVVSAATERNPGVSEAALPAQQRMRDELSKQIGRDGPRQAINQANNQSIIMDTTQTSGGPVRVVKEGRAPFRDETKIAPLPKSKAPTGTLRYTKPAPEPVTPVTKPPAKTPRGVKIPKGLAKAGAVVAGVLPIFDAADAVAGTVGAVDNTKSKGDRMASTLQAISGATGLASLHPAAAPITGPISLATAGLAAATQRRADMDKPKPKPAGYGQGTSGVQAQVKPITNHNRASLKPTPNMPKQKEKSPLDHLINEGGWALKQLGINL